MKSNRENQTKGAGPMQRENGEIFKKDGNKWGIQFKNGIETVNTKRRAIQISKAFYPEYLEKKDALEK